MCHCLRRKVDLAALAAWPGCLIILIVGLGFHFPSGDTLMRPALPRTVLKTLVRDPITDRANYVVQVGLPAQQPAVRSTLFTRGRSVVPSPLHFGPRPACRNGRLTDLMGPLAWFEVMVAHLLSRFRLLTRK